jgi:molybdopterin-guanine dinucleotide biosynthesis protein A
MPFLNGDVIRLLCGIEGEYDAIAPDCTGGAQPLHTVYAKSALDTVNRAIEAGEKRLYILLEQMATRRVTADELAGIPEAAKSFLNVNTPEEYGAVSVGQPPVCEPEAPQKTS